MKILNRLLMLAALCALSAFAVLAQDAAPAAQGGGNVCEEAARGDLYTKYYNLKKTDQKAAYDIGQQYLQKYTSCNDQYVTAVKKFVDAYSEATIKLDFQKAVFGTDDKGTGKDYTKAFALGKEILASDPDNLPVLINLGYAGYVAQSPPMNNNSFNADALVYAKKAVPLIESGKAPEKWTPFTNKDEALAYLNYAIGEYTIKDSPTAALPYYLKAAAYETPVKKSPVTYGRIAAAYYNGQYIPMQKDYAAKYEGKEESAESKYALNNLYQVLDRVIDAYARGVSYAGSDPKLQAVKAEYTKTLTEIYKVRNNNKTDGLDTLIASAASKPLPQPFVPQPFVPPTPAATPTPAPASSTPPANGAAVSDTTSTTTTTNTATAPKPVAATSTTKTTTSTTTTKAKPTKKP